MGYQDHVTYLGGQGGGRGQEGGCHHLHLGLQDGPTAGRGDSRVGRKQGGAKAGQGRAGRKQQWEASKRVTSCQLVEESTRQEVNFYAFPCKREPLKCPCNMHGHCTPYRLDEDARASGPVESAAALCFPEL
jgi:hypothetical protein